MKQSTINAIGILALLFFALSNDTVGWFFGCLFGLIFMLLTLFAILFGTDEVRVTFKNDD